MKATEWLSASSRKAIAESVRAVEAKTSAEVVVTVRARSSPYRHVDVPVGAAFAFLLLAIYVYAPITFPDEPAPPAIALGFVGAALLSASSSWSKRRMVPARARRDAVRAAARVAFFDQGVARAPSRRGVLVFVSLLEREVEVVVDVGVDVPAMGEAWGRSVAAIQAAARSGADVATVRGLLGAMGDALASAMPATDDDVNELPDEVAA